MLGNHNLYISFKYHKGIMNKLVHLRISEKLYSEAKNFSKESGFSNVQEFIRNSIRKSVEDYELRKSLKKIESLKGSMPSTTSLTHEERKQIAKKVLSEDQSEIFRELNLN